jgi:hypothetical protein
MFMSHILPASTKAVKSSIQACLHGHNAVRLAGMKLDVHAILKAYRSEFARQGGKARAQALSPKRRRDIAQSAARARWKKKKSEAA